MKICQTRLYTAESSIFDLNRKTKFTIERKDLDEVEAYIFKMIKFFNKKILDLGRNKNPMGFNSINQVILPADLE